jgi:hypothetical protein
MKFKSSSNVQKEVEKKRCGLDRFDCIVSSSNILHQVMSGVCNLGNHSHQKPTASS